MNSVYLSEYPPSYTYSEIIDKISKNKNIAYCYVGDREGDIIILDKFGDIKSLSSKYNAKNSKVLGLKGNHELWAFVDDMEDNNVFRQMSINRLFSIYCEYYYYLYSNNIDLFKEKFKEE